MIKLLFAEGMFMTEEFLLDENRLKSVEENYKSVLDSVKESAVKAGRDENEVRLMCVTKTVEPPYINKVLELGADLIGENRVQEYLGKRDKLNLNGVERHLIGHLQTNKVRQIVGEVDMIESVSSLKLAKEISRVSVSKGIAYQIYKPYELNKLYLCMNRGNKKPRIGESARSICGFQ